MRLGSFLFRVALMSLAGLGVATEQPGLEGRDLNIDQPQLEARVFTPLSRLGTRASPGLPTIVNRDLEEVDLETRRIRLSKWMCKLWPNSFGCLKRKRGVEEPELQTRRLRRVGEPAKKPDFSGGPTRFPKKVCGMLPSLSGCRKGRKRNVEEPRLETRKSCFSPSNDLNDMIRCARERGRRTKKA